MIDVNMLRQRLSTCSCRGIFVSVLVAATILTYMLDFWHLEFQIPAYLKPLEDDSGISLSTPQVSALRPTSAREGFFQDLNKAPIGVTKNVSDFDQPKKTIASRIPIIKYQPRTTRFPHVGPSANPTSQNRTTSDSHLPSYHDSVVNCAKLIANDQEEHVRAEKWDEDHPKEKVSDDKYITMSKDCNEFRNARKYISKPLSQEETDFPIAYSILVYKDAEQFERLLRAIYHPQNWYCVHVDSKAVDVFWRAMQSITGCFKNVFLASHRSDVEWGRWTVLEPELTCMKDLLKFKKWRYFINLTGQEFPLKTNLDLVRILGIYNGSNNMEGTVKRMNTDRIKDKSTVPHRITITKGSVHITASRGFVEFVINDKRALDFGKWLKDTSVPDETFFSSLNHSPQLGVPGAYTGEPETDTENYQFLTRFKNWGTYPFSWECGGQRVRSVCVFGVGDLPLLASRYELFANKFFLEYKPFALNCMEELHYNRTHSQVVGDGQYILDLSIYHKMLFVDNHL